MHAAQAMEFLASIKSAEIKSPGGFIINRSKSTDGTFQVNGDVAVNSLPLDDVCRDKFSRFFAQDLKVGLGELDQESDRCTVGEEVSAGSHGLDPRLEKNRAQC